MDCTSRLALVGINSGFPLICGIDSAHHTQGSIKDNECWMVIGWCKKPTRGWQLDQSHEHYIS